MQNLDRKIFEAVSYLQKGGILAHATETCYGFACDALNENVLRKLYSLKRMELIKPVSIMVASLKQARIFGTFNDSALGLARKYWPGPLTIIVKRTEQLPAFVNPKCDSVGFRCPSHNATLEIIKRFGGPLTTTSANISGLPSAYSVEEILAQFRGGEAAPFFMIDSGKIPNNPPSTVVDCTGNKIKIIRRGEITLEKDL